MSYGGVRQIEAFRCFMVTGGVTAAARMMGVSQPAVSRLLRDLEAELKLDLFERRGAGLGPTAAATALYAEVERSFVGLDRIRASAEDIRTRRTGALRIASLPALANGFLPRFAGTFLKDRPGLDLGLFGVISPLVIDWVASRQCDFGFAEGHMAHPGLERIDMPALDRVAVMPDGHPLAALERLRPEDFEGETFISLSLGTASRHMTDELFAQRKVTRVLRVETHLSEIVCGLVASGVGVGVADPFTAREFAGRGVVARPMTPAIPFEFAAYHAPDRPLSPMARDFIDGFRAHILANVA